MGWMRSRENQRAKAGRVKCEGGWMMVLGISPFCSILRPD